MDSIYDLEVSKEDELYLRNNWKLISTCQFVNLFKNVIKLKDPLTPYDLEQSLLRPQHDPLCAELMSRLLHKRVIRKDQNGVEIQPKNDNFQVLDYDSWNQMLAKKFSMMHKNFRKFSIRFLGKDPLYKPDQNMEDYNNNLMEEEYKQQQDQQIVQDMQYSQQNQDQDQQNNQNEEIKEHNNNQENNEFVGDQVQIDTREAEEKKDDSKPSAAMQSYITERMTRSRLAKLNNPYGGQQSQSQTTTKQQKTKNGKKAGKQQQASESNQSQDNLLSQKPEEKQVVVEQVWSSDIREHLLKQHKEENITIRFSHEAAVGGAGLQNQWKTESLQIIKLFNEELDGIDPFYIEGQDWNQQQKEDQTNYWSNFVDTEAIEDFEDYQFQMNSFGSKQVEVLFKKFHEIPTQYRLSILYFLCQHKLDGESPEFMTEIQNLHSIKPSKFETEDGQPLKMSDELKQWLEPINMALLKPLGIFTKDLGPFTQNEITVEIKPGKYFYFPFFQDTRIYRQSFDLQVFELYMEDYEHIQTLMALLREHENDEEAFQFLEKLTKYQECLKKCAEEMKWREQTKARKLKSQIRSRRLQDMSRKKLQFEGRQNQYQTDYLHHATGNVMTRRQVDTVKQKFGRGSKNQQQLQAEESDDTYGGGNNKKRDAKERGVQQSAREKYQEQLKQRQEKERQDRQRRLEKRMRLKEIIAGGGRQLGKRKRGNDSDEEDSYYDDYGGEEQQSNQKTGQEEEQEEQKADLQYDIVLNGDLIMIFQRDEANPNQLINVTMVIKGHWKLSIEDFQEEFIYKKINSPLQEELLTELFCERPQDKVNSQNVQIQAPNEQLQSVIDQFLNSQGLYQGYFKYNEEDVTENFSFIMRKPRASKKQNHFDICGYGENNIGPFTMEGTLQLYSFEKLQEKGGVKNFIKLKLGKFQLTKQYKKKILEELVDEVKEERNPMQNMQIEDDMPAEYRDLLMMQTPDQVQKKNSRIAPPQQNQDNYNQNDQQHSLPKLPQIQPNYLQQLGQQQFQDNNQQQLLQLLANQQQNAFNQTQLQIPDTIKQYNMQEQASHNIVPQFLFSQVMNKNLEDDQHQQQLQQYLQSQQNLSMNLPLQQPPFQLSQMIELQQQQQQNFANILAQTNLQQPSQNQEQLPQLPSLSQNVNIIEQKLEQISNLLPNVIGNIQQQQAKMSRALQDNLLQNQLLNQVPQSQLQHQQDQQVLQQQQYPLPNLVQQAQQLNQLQGQGFQALPVDINQILAQQILQQQQNQGSNQQQ